MIILFPPNVFIF